MKSSLIVLAALLTSWGAPSRVAEPAVGAPDRIQWEISWDAAVARAKSEKMPIMIHFNMDDEPACANMAKSHFKNRKLIELSQKFVCVVGSLGNHPSEKTFSD